MTRPADEEVIAAFHRAAELHGIPLDRVQRRHVEELIGSGRWRDRTRGGRAFAEWRSMALGTVPTLAVPPGHVVRGVSTLVDSSGATVMQWVKTRREEDDPVALVREILAELPEHVTPRDSTVPAPRDRMDDDLLAVYPIGDHHLGMLAWAPESGADYDIGIAESLLRRAIDELSMATPRAQTAMLVNVGDFLHTDNYSAVSAASGHSFDTDSRWSKILRSGVALLVYAVDRLLETHERVIVECKPGNHDRHSAVMLCLGLELYYRNEPRVTVNATPSYFSYQRWGKCLVGVTHGDTVKIGDLPLVMAADRPEDWGATRYRYWYTGHVHHTRRQEYGGCVVESFRTLAARDAWHASQRYRSGRDMHRIVLHREHGEISRSIISADYLMGANNGDG